MAITSFAGNSQPMALSEMAHSQVTITIGSPSVVEDIDFEYCGYECDYIEYAFHGNTPYENDYKTLLEENEDPNGSITFYLVKDGVETILDTNAYGTPYAFGSITNHESLAGYDINWLNVSILLGNGDYHIKTEIDFFGDVTEKTSHVYRLQPFNVAQADKTVKLESVQNGCIENGFDYTDLNWRRMHRLPAVFKIDAPVEEVSNYIGTNRTVKQIQEKVHYAYNLNTEPIPIAIGNLILTDMLLGNIITATDYNIFGDNLRDIDVVKITGSERTPLDQDRKSAWSFKLEDKVQNTVKRN